MSATWVFTEESITPQAIEVTDTTQRLPLGTIRKARNVATSPYGEGEFIYLVGVASTAIGSWVTYNYDDFSTALLVANAIGPVAVAMSANVASQYGWYQISGKAIGLAKTAFADNGNVYGTATAGSIDDAIVAGDRVQGAKGASAVNETTLLAEFEISRPFVNDALAD